MPAARGRRPPVTLRDFLDLGCESSSDGFRSYPRCGPCDGGVLQQAPARPHVVEAKLSRSPSWSPSAFFLTKSPGSALARISSLSRNFSRRISFWRRREFDNDLDDRDSCGFPSPLVSSCSSASESETDIVIEETSAHAPAPLFEGVSASASASSSSADRDVPGAAGDGHEVEMQALGDGDPAVGRRNLEAMEDKQQLSPVSVLDFPFDDDDGDEEERSDAGTCSPSFLQNHSGAAANLQRKKKKAQQMLHKIRRFDDGPTTEAVDLDARFTTPLESGEESVDDAHGRCAAHLPSNSCSTDDSEAAKTTASPRHDYEEEHQSIEERSQGQLQEPDEEYRLLARRLDDDTAASSTAVDEISEWLLLDFFAEGIGRLRSSVAGPVVGTTANKPPHDGSKVTAALVDAAMDWLRGAGPQWGVGDVMFSGESALKDMERSRRWMCVHEEEQDVGAEVEAFVMDGLLDELVTELVPCLVARRRLIMEPGTVS